MVGSTETAHLWCPESHCHLLWRAVVGLLRRPFNETILDALILEKLLAKRSDGSMESLHFLLR